MGCGSSAVKCPARGGTDKHLVVWQPSTDQLWEFWRLEHDPQQAGRPGGVGRCRTCRLIRVSTAPKPGLVHSSGWGASASSLSIAGGLITLEDLEKGQINHALAMALPNIRADVYASPAERTDGGDTEPLSLPEGAHLRLDPNLESRRAAPSAVDVDDGRSGATLRDRSSGTRRRTWPSMRRIRPRLGRTRTPARTATSKESPQVSSWPPSLGSIFNCSRWKCTARRERARAASRVARH